MGFGDWVKEKYDDVKDSDWKPMGAQNWVESGKEFAKGNWGEGAKEFGYGVLNATSGGFGQAGIEKGGRWIDEKFISGDTAARNRANEEKAAIDARLNKRMDESFKTQAAINDQRHRDAGTARTKMNASDEAYGSRVSKLADEARNSATNASIVYNRMGNEYGQMQERANREANSAMSLSEYMNPNNKVNQQTRGVYNDEGTFQRGQYDAEAARQRDQYNAEGAYQQKFYDDQASGETRQGQADYGVLSSLGAQASGQAFQGPMTVGQQMAMMAANQRQAGEAYANTQRRVQNLRDQGLQANLGNRNKGLDTATTTRGRGLDTQGRLRERGIEAGFERNDAAFAAGENARDRQRAIMGDRRGLENEYRDFQMRNRGEREGFSQSQLGSELRRSGRDLEVNNLRTGMDFEMERAKVAEEMRRAGVDENRINAVLAQIQGDTAARQAVASGVVSAVGAAVGGYYGGPQGAQAGSQAGRAVPQGGGATTAGSGQSPYGPAGGGAGFQGQPNTQGPNYQGSAFGSMPSGGFAGQSGFAQGSGEMGGAFGQYLRGRYGGRPQINA